MWDLSSEEYQLLEKLRTLHIFDGKDSGETEEILPFFRFLDLSVLNLMTMRDLMGYGGHQNDTPLWVVLGLMFSVLEEGSLCLDLNRENLLNRFPSHLKDKTGRIIDVFLRNLADEKYETLIAGNNDNYLPLVLDESKGERLLYFQKYHVHENRLKDNVEKFLQAENSCLLSPSEMDHILDRIYSDTCVIRIGNGKNPIVRDQGQVNALKTALKTQFSIITGGPGTGKTSLMVNIIRCLVRTGIKVSDIILAAPTGRAAQRMTEALQNNIASIENPSRDDLDLLHLKGSTLHKILRYRSSTHDFYYRDTNPLPASVVVVDEVSMVDVVMLDTFLQALDSSKSKLILLGDKDQLPSVDAGAVFAEMIPDGSRAASFGDRLTVLQKVYRSGTNLMDLAMHVNKGELPPFEEVSFETALSSEPDRWSFIDSGRGSVWKEHLHYWVQHHYLNPPEDHARSYRELIIEAEKVDPEHLAASETGRDLLHGIFSFADRARILSSIRNGIYGCNWINTLISDYLISELDPFPASGTDSFSGALILITRNDYSKGLFNGDVGVMIKDPATTYKTFFRRGEEYVGFPTSLLPSRELAFAMTVHKSQGSEFDNVLLVLPEDENNRLLTREIIYTGITRAKERVSIYGAKSVLKSAIRRKIERQSGFKW